jgi:hypothetical protein
MNQHVRSLALLSLLALGACTEGAPSAPSALGVPTTSARSVASGSCVLASSFSLTIVYQGVGYTHNYSVTGQNGASFTGVAEYGVASVTEVIDGTFDGANLTLTSVYMKDGVPYTDDAYPNGYSYTLTGVVDAEGSFVGGGYGPGQIFEDGSATGSGVATCADTEPPTISMPADVTVEAGPGGFGTLSLPLPTATDNSGEVTVECDYTSGASFPLGTTIVTCTATDPSGNAASGQFAVRVVDTTAPSLNVPADITVNATSSRGAIVTFSASATDIAAGSVPVSCDPVSGSTFAIGTTMVQCMATDPTGNTTTGTFKVTVVSSLAVLIADLTHCIDATRLPPPIKLRLLAYVQELPTTLEGLTPEQKLGGIAVTQSFISFVESLPPGAIPVVERTCLIEVARQIIALLQA